MATAKKDQDKKTTQNEQPINPPKDDKPKGSGIETMVDKTMSNELDKDDKKTQETPKDQESGKDKSNKETKTVGQQVIEFKNLLDEYLDDAGESFDKKFMNKSSIKNIMDKLIDYCKKQNKEINYESIKDTIINMIIKGSIKSLPKDCTMMNKFIEDEVRVALLNELDKSFKLDDNLLEELELTSDEYKSALTSIINANRGEARYNAVVRMQTKLMKSALDTYFGEDNKDIKKLVETINSDLFCINAVKYLKECLDDPKERLKSLLNDFLTQVPATMILYKPDLKTIEPWYTENQADMLRYARMTSLINSIYNKEDPLVKAFLEREKTYDYVLMKYPDEIEAEEKVNKDSTEEVKDKSELDLIIDEWFETVK